MVAGSGVLVTREEPKNKDSESFIHLSKGTCVRTEVNVFHTVYAITEMTIIAMLTKQWDHSNPPIVRIDE